MKIFNEHGIVKEEFKTVAERYTEDRTMLVRELIENVEIERSYWR